LSTKQAIGKTPVFKKARCVFVMTKTGGPLLRLRAGHPPESGRWCSQVDAWFCHFPLSPLLSWSLKTLLSKPEQFVLLAVRINLFVLNRYLQCRL
jgi:hypothetical protein